MPKRLANLLLRFLQSLNLYRVLIRRLISRNIQYRLATVEDARGISKLYGFEKSSELNGPAGFVGREYDSQESFRYTLVASVNNSIAGTTVIRRFSDQETLYTDWWLFGMNVRIRYRGAGIGEGMVRMALRKASEAGAARINLMVYENNKAAVGLYRKMGFRRTSIPGLDEKLEKEVQEGRNRRIIMSRPLD